MTTYRSIFRFWKHSIQIKIGLTLIMLTTLILSGFGLYQYRELKSSKLKQLHTLAENTSIRLTKNLILFLWHMEYEKATEAIQTEMRERSLYAIMVNILDEGRIVGKQRDEDWEIIDFTSDLSEEFIAITMSQELIKEGEQIGTVSIHFTDRFMQEELAGDIKHACSLLSS